LRASAETQEGGMKAKRLERLAFWLLTLWLDAFRKRYFGHQSNRKPAD
jgi:hypothetical protein